MSDEELIGELRLIEQGLVIVNSRKHALDLYLAGRATGLDGIVHLTTRQTAADRRPILESVRQSLSNKLPCRLIATCLVEAGVDISFPHVWRAETGLDQIIHEGVNRNAWSGRRIIAGESRLRRKAWMKLQLPHVGDTWIMSPSKESSPTGLP